MKSVLLIFFAFASFQAFAFAYNFTPSKETMEGCEELGMYGEFELNKFEGSGSGRGYFVTFLETGFETYVIESDVRPKRFGTLVECRRSCRGEIRVLLDLNKLFFSYKRDLYYPKDDRRIYEFCKGNVD